MKRLAQFVVLAIVALIAAQPLLAYASCASESCVRDACPPVCCGGMSERHGSMHSTADCHSQMDARPVNTGCGLSSLTLAIVAKEQAPAGQEPAGSRAAAVIVSALPQFATAASPTFAWSPHDASEAVDRGVLYRVFRI